MSVDNKEIAPNLSQVSTPVLTLNVRKYELSWAESNIPWILSVIGFSPVIGTFCVLTASRKSYFMAFIGFAIGCFIIASDVFNMLGYYDKYSQLVKNSSAQLYNENDPFYTRFAMRSILPSDYSSVDQQKSNLLGLLILSVWTAFFSFLTIGSIIYLALRVASINNRQPEIRDQVIQVKKNPLHWTDRNFPWSFHVLSFGHYSSLLSALATEKLSIVAFILGILISLIELLFLALNAYEVHKLIVESKESFGWSWLYYWLCIPLHICAFAFLVKSFTSFAKSRKAENNEADWLEDPDSSRRIIFSKNVENVRSKSISNLKSDKEEHKPYRSTDSLNINRVVSI